MCEATWPQQVRPSSSGGPDCRERHWLDKTCATRTTYARRQADSRMCHATSATTCPQVSTAYSRAPLRSGMASPEACVLLCRMAQLCMTTPLALAGRRAEPMTIHARAPMVRGRGRPNQLEYGAGGDYETLLSQEPTGLVRHDDQAQRSPEMPDGRRSPPRIGTSSMGGLASPASGPAAHNQCLSVRCHSLAQLLTSRWKGHSRNTYSCLPAPVGTQ